MKKIFRIIFGVGFMLGLATVTLAQDIAILKSADISPYSEAITAFTAALPSSFRITQTYDLEGDVVQGRTFAHRIQASHPTVVLAVGLKAALAAKAEISNIPVIFCLVMDPEKYGLPTANMVGLSWNIPFRQRLKPLQILNAPLSRIGVLYDPNKTKGLQHQLLRDAKGRGIHVFSKAVHSEQEVPTALNDMKDHIDALWLLPDSTVLTENTLDFLVSTTLEAHIPVVGFSASLVRSGVVVGAYIPYADIGIEAAQLSQQVVKRPSSVLGTLIPPERIYQSINIKSARYLNLALTPDVLRQFDEQF